MEGLSRRRQYESEKVVSLEDTKIKKSYTSTKEIQKKKEDLDFKNYIL